MVVRKCSGCFLNQGEIDAGTILPVSTIVCVKRGKLCNGFGSSICAYHLNVFTAGSLFHTTCQVGSSRTRTGDIVSFPDSLGCQEVAH